LNAVEIEEAISQLADLSFDPENFPYSFLEAFGNKETTIKRLRAGASNKSDLGGVLQPNNIHIVTCSSGMSTKTLAAMNLRKRMSRIRVFDPACGSGNFLVIAYKESGPSKRRSTSGGVNRIVAPTFR